MRRWLTRGVVGLLLLTACGGDATSPSYSLDLAEIGTAPVSQWLQVPDSARVGEPFVVTAFAANRGCETPGGLSVTEEAGRVRIVGAVQVGSGGTQVCPTPGRWSQSTSLTPTIEGPLTILLVGRVGDRTDSISSTVYVLPRRALAPMRAFHGSISRLAPAAGHKGDNAPRVALRPVYPAL